MVLCMEYHDKSVNSEDLMKDALNESFKGLWIARYIHWVENHHDWWENGIVFSPLVGGSNIRKKLIKKKYIVIKHKGNSFVIFCNTNDVAKYKIKDRDFWEDLESFKESPDYLSLVNSDVDGHADVEELPVKVQSTAPPEEKPTKVPTKATPVSDSVSFKTVLSAEEPVEESVQQVQSTESSEETTTYIVGKKKYSTKDEAVAARNSVEELTGEKLDVRVITTTVVTTVTTSFTEEIIET